MPFYFAYGANMSWRVFEQRRQITPLTTQRAEAPGYRRAFTQPGVPFIEPSFATLIKDRESTCWGALYEISEADMKRLQQMETEYHSMLVNVISDTHRVSATTFACHQHVAGRKPSRRYMGLLLEGARELKLPSATIASLSQQPTSHVPVISSVVPFVARLLDRSRR